MLRGSRPKSRLQASIGGFKRGNEMINLAVTGKRALVVIGAVAMWAASPPPAQAAGGAVWNRGDVLAASGAGGPYGGGTIQQFDSNGNLIRTLDTTTGSQM